MGTGGKLGAAAVTALLLSTTLPPAGGVFIYLCDGEIATLVGSKGNDHLRGTEGPDVIVGRGGHDLIQGLGGDDLLCGRGGNDTLIGGSGDDRLFGGSGRVDGDYLFGGDGNDRLSGGKGASTNRLFGGPGDDRLGGRGDSDIASFLFSPEPVDVDLVVGTASGEGEDLLQGIESIQGSSFDDSLIGDDGANTLIGESGDDEIHGNDGLDVIVPGDGDDTIDAGAPIQNQGSTGDYLSFRFSGAPVTADLRIGRAAGEGDDNFTGVESLIGSDYFDLLHGDDWDNYIDGGLLFSPDEVYGYLGNDNIQHARRGDAGPGDDRCIDAPLKSCEFNAIVDPSHIARIVEPSQGSTITAQDLKRIRVEAHEALGPMPDGFQIAIRLIEPDGCRWFDARRSSLRRKPCTTSIWNRLGKRGEAEWALELDRVLPAGRYEITLSSFFERSERHYLDHEVQIDLT